MPLASCLRTLRSVAPPIFGRPSFTPWATARRRLRSLFVSSSCPRSVARFFHSLQGRTPMPVTLLYGCERARVARLVLSLLRTVRNAYTPELTLASEFLFLMMHSRPDVRRLIRPTTSVIPKQRLL